jgi:thiamine-phosphate pyrophosphorylase
MRPALNLSVYLITDPGMCAARGLVATVLAAVRGGATLVQLRDKQACDEDLAAQGRTLQDALRGTGVPLIINDRVAVAKAIGAAGVHVGQSDLAAAHARALLGPAAIVGVSVETLAHVRAVDPRLVDYVGVGPVFATSTKEDHAAPLGFAGLAALCAESPVPAVAIGGVKAEHVAAVLAAGARGLAVVSAICAAADPEVAAHSLSRTVREQGAGEDG